MTSLTDRYVHVTVRNLDEGQRHDVEQELRGTIEDMVDARLDAGAAASRDDAERAVLVELGDPMRLAAEYTGRPLHLIGPAIYPEWRRLVTLLLWTVVPVVTVINLVLRLFVDDLASEGVGAAFASSAGLGLQVALHVVFWTTLVYALVERSQPGKAVIAWDPDQLPEDDGRSVGIGETVSSVVMLLLVGLALIWQQTNSPLEVDGESVPVLDPALWSGWIPFLLGVVVAQIVVALAVFRARRWTWGLAGIAAALDVAASAAVLWLLFTGRLLNPAFVDAMVANGWTSVERDLTLSLTLGIVLAVGIEHVGQLRRAYASSR
jgi:hypothetical protein